MPIFDQGYQHFSGQLSGNAWRWLVIARDGVRTQLKNRAVRILLLFAWIPAVALVAALAVWGLIEQKSESVISFLGPMLSSFPGLVTDPVVYRSAVWTLAYSYFFATQLFLIMLLVVAVGPGLISRDLRFNALPLYFARPIRRFDYFLGKLGVIGALVAAVAVVPAIFAYLMGVCFSLDLTVVRDTYRLLFASLAYGLVIVVSVGTLMLALSSLTRRSLLVSIAWFGIWVIGGSVANTLAVIQFHSLSHVSAEDVSADMATEDIAALHTEPEPPKGRKLPPVEKQAKQADRQRQEQAQQRRFALMQAKMQQNFAEAARTDWRPLFSFRANLQRVGEALLGTDTAWVELGRIWDVPGRMAKTVGAVQQAPNERFLADSMVPQYPWIWSAGVLAGLGAVSLWILTFRVKSLDRLK